MFILLQVLFVIIGFILLMKGADYFVDGAVAVAEQLGIPHIVVGLTIVAFGTSAPEAAVSISSSLSGNNGIAVGNVLGSNIMNILVILGITSCIIALKIQKDTSKIDIPFLLAVSVILPILGLYFQELNVLTGILFWVLLLAYIAFLVVKAIRTETETDEDSEPLSAIRIIIYIIGGIIAVILGSQFAVKGASAIATFLGVSDRIIGLTIVAFGTSLPELMTSVSAARKGNADIAVGNIVGSNLFNILFILGTTSLIRPIPFGPEYIIDSILGIVAVFLLFILPLKNKHLERKHGILFLIIYAVYLGYLIVLH